jgi:hypothetical protein
VSAAISTKYLSINSPTFVNALCTGALISELNIVVVAAAAVVAGGSGTDNRLSALDNVENPLSVLVDSSSDEEQLLPLSEGLPAAIAGGGATMSASALSLRKKSTKRRTSSTS